MEKASYKMIERHRLPVELILMSDKIERPGACISEQSHLQGLILFSVSIKPSICTSN